MNFELTIIIPVYNEEDNLDRVHQEMKQFLSIAKKRQKSYLSTTVPKTTAKH